MSLPYSRRNTRRFAWRGLRLIHCISGGAYRARRAWLEWKANVLMDQDGPGGTNMKTSARNHFAGVVSHIQSGAVNDEVTLKVGNTAVVAIVTRESTQALGLAVGSPASALIKASSVIVMVDADPAKVSARNVFSGTVTSVKAGAVNSDVTISADGLSVAAIITNDSVARLGLAPGKAAAAVVKASSVILAVE